MVKSIAWIVVNVQKNHLIKGFVIIASKTAQCRECVIKPELCRAHLGEGRDMEWEREHHLKDHYVYLAVSSGVKVGITRDTQVPTRWIDQVQVTQCLLLEHLIVIYVE